MGATHRSGHDIEFCAARAFLGASLERRGVQRASADQDTERTCGPSPAGWAGRRLRA